MTVHHASISTATLGYARMGPRRELKFALEKYWRAQMTLTDLLAVASNVETMTWDLAVQAGVDRVTVGDQYLYDGLLTWTEWLGIVPTRFGTMKSGADRMFAMARGVDGAPALSKYKTFVCGQISGILICNYCVSLFRILLKLTYGLLAYLSFH